MSRNSRQRRFIRAAALPAAVAWVGMLGVGGVLMQTGCPIIPTTPLSVSATAVPATGVAGSYTVTLAATATGGRTPYTYAWTVAPATGATITNATSATASAAIATAGTYTFTITVTDAAGTTASKNVTATATVPPLVANAGVDQSVAKNVVATLTATSTGGTGTKTYAWTKVSGVNGAPATPATASTTVPTTALGSTTYRVTVTDSATTPVTATDDVVVTVTPLSLTVAATATPASLALPSTSTLSCTPAEGTPPYSFSWLQTGGVGPAVLVGANNQSAVATFGAVGAYTFTVTVVDNAIPAQNVTSSVVTVTVTSTSLAFTTSPLDNLVGSTGNDTFSGTDTTLQSSDQANGGDGTDTLMISLAANVAATLPTMTSIETVSVSDPNAGGSSFNFTNVTGVATLNFLAPAGSQTVTNLAAIPAVNVSSSAQDISVGFKAAAVSGTTDALSLGLSAVTAGTITIPDIETISIASNTSANTLTALTSAAATALNVTGSADLTITGALGNTVATVAAGTATGAIKLTTGGPGATTAIAVTTGSGADDITVGNAAGTISTGAGNDKITFADGQFVITTGTSLDTVAGGDGTDTLVVSNADAANAASTLTNVTGIEALTISDALAGTITAPYFGTIATVNVPNGFNGGTLNVATGATVNVNASGASAGAATIQVAGTATTDAVTLVFKAANAMSGATDFAKIETATVDTTTAAGTFTGAVTVNTAGNTRNLTIVGSNTCTFNAGVTANTINASALTGALVMTTTTVAPLGATITGGSGGDTLIGSATASVGDIITGGTGADIIRGDGTADGTVTAGADIITLGTGNSIDTVVVTTVAASSANADTVTDFVLGAATSYGDKFSFDLSALETAGAVSAGAINFLDLGAGTDVAAGAGAVQEISASGGTATTSGKNVFVLVGATFANTGAVETALETGGSRAITGNAACDAAGVAFPVVYSDGTDTYVAIAYAAARTTDNTAYESGDLTVVNVAKLPGKTSIAAGDFSSDNFAFQN